ncbi:DMT family transporter [bacterium]|nr:DMT family transporter [bacterium]
MQAARRSFDIWSASVFTIALILFAPVISLIALSFGDSDGLWAHLFDTVLTAGLSYAFAGVWAKRHLSTQPPILNAFGMLLGSTVLLTPIVFFIEGAPAVALAPKVWTSLIALSLVSTALAYLLYFEILRRAGSANLMLVTLLIPPVTIALSYTFLGERVEQEALYGLGLIALGLGVTDGRVLDLMSKRYRQFKNAI